MIDGELIESLEKEARFLFERLERSVLGSWPKAKCATFDTRREDQASRTFSVLHSASGDAVEIALELRHVEEKLWAEATLYVGQETSAVLSSSLWSNEGPTGSDVAALLRDFVALLEPRLIVAVALVASREQ